MSRMPFKVREAGSLKAAVSALVIACGGQKHAAGICRVSATQIRKYTDSDLALCHMPVDIVAVLEAHCGDPIVTRFLALERGRLVVDLPKAGDGPYSEKLARMSEEGGKTFADGARAISDGTLSLRDARKLKAEALELASAVCGFIGDLDGRIAGGKP